YTNDGSFGAIKAQTWGAPTNVQATTCDGVDGELHVGALAEGSVCLRSRRHSRAKRLPTTTIRASVFELPDAKAGKGPATLTSTPARRSRSTATFAPGTRVIEKAKCVGATRIMFSSICLAIHLPVSVS